MCRRWSRFGTFSDCDVNLVVGRYMIFLIQGIYALNRVFLLVRDFVVCVSVYEEKKKKKEQELGVFIALRALSRRDWTVRISRGGGTSPAH